MSKKENHSDVYDTLSRAGALIAIFTILLVVLASAVSSESTKTGKCQGVCAAYGQQYISRSENDKGDTMYCTCDASMHTWSAFVKEHRAKNEEDK